MNNTIKVPLQVLSGIFLINNKENQKDKSLQKIRELKQLLDEGIITQEEFNIKKNELLGL